MPNSKRKLMRFSVASWLTLGMFFVSAATVVLYVQAAKQIDRANELRQQSFLLTEELRQSSDDLTRIVRTYVATGDAIWKRHYQEILDIREGRSPRPANYHGVYWDLVMPDDARPSPSEDAVPLLTLMVRAGFTDEEFFKLAEAKANSDALTQTEFAAMKLIEATVPATAANRQQASYMLIDADYHQAKARIMKPIRDVTEMMGRRTSDAVLAAEGYAMFVRIVLTVFGAVLLFQVWWTRKSLRGILGGNLDDVYSAIARLGHGDFSSVGPVATAVGDTILGQVSASQASLARLDSERKQAQDALQVSESRRRVATDSGRVGIWEVDLKTNHLTWDDNCFLLYRMPKEDFKGTFEQWSGTIHPQDFDVVVRSFQNAVSGISKYDPSFRIVWPDGTVRYVQAHGEVLRDKDGIPDRMIGTNWDITDLKRSEQAIRDSEAAQSANLAKSIFLANMSHELRTPMSGVMGMIDLALGRAIDPQQVDWLNKSKRSAMHLMSVINDILDISKIEADRMTLEERIFSVSDVLGDAILMLDESAHGKGLDLKLELDPSAPDLLCGDAMRLKQIVLNYLSNAVKFSAHGSVKLRTQLIEQNEDNVMLRIEVIDQGIGISAAQQARLFKSFTQADDSTTRKFGGTGLGLFISSRIAQMMGGDTGVISHEGRGSMFWVTVRLRCAVEEAQTESQLLAHSQRELLAQRFNGSRVLLVEDDEVNQEIGVLMLEAAGLVVDVASNGKEAVEKAESGAYAAILMDVQMPVMNGLDATRAIRLLPGFQGTPIVAMSANAFNEDRERSLDAGMNDHIGKPVLPDTLYSTLLRWMA